MQARPAKLVVLLDYHCPKSQLPGPNRRDVPAGPAPDNYHVVAWSFSQNNTSIQQDSGVRIQEGQLFPDS